MKRDLAWWLRIAVATVAAAALGVGLYGAGVHAGSTGGKRDNTTTGVGADGITLVAFDSCDTALDELRDAALPLVGPYGLFGPYAYATDTRGGGVVPPRAPAAAEAPSAPGPGAPGVAERDAGAGSGQGAGADSQQKQAPGYSSTNTHEAGVDEPDLVKTDGRRVITIADGKLRVVDVASRAVTATLEIPGGPATQLLLSGDRALVMTMANHVVPQQKPVPPGPGPNDQGFGSQLVLVDLSAGAKVLGTLSVEGAYLDARQVGSVARVVVRSGPHLGFVYPDGVRSDTEALRQNREVVRQSAISDWLPRYELQRNGSRQSGQLVDCAAVSHPESYTGTSMLTVLTVDLTKELGTGDPVSIVADGDTVYGTGTSLYVADDHFPHGAEGFGPGPMPRRTPQPGPQRTEVYQFDISGPGKPVYVASGGVDGTLLNQYSLSEHAGHLRVATTTGQPGGFVDQPGQSESMVTVLARQGDTLAAVGKVGGLGVGERIYAVRFFGPVGFVVTFRQTDPLYTVDLSNPTQPKVVGELKITGYSAYLHSAGSGRLIGVGQEASEQGRQLGTQVSLFDTSNLTATRRVAQYHLSGGHSEVEGDPHAFLYWQEKGLVVIPVWAMPSRSVAPSAIGAALVLRLTGDSFTEIGRIEHPVDQQRHPDGGVRRALVVGNELWTVSGSGAMVNDVDQLAKLAWIPFS